MLTPVQKHNNIWYKRDDLYAPYGDVNGGKVRQTVTSMTVQNGQVVESKSQTKEITMRLDKLNNTGRENVDASKQGASQTRRLNSSIATG